MSKILTVQPVAQISSDTCWHAAASMLWNYSQSITGRQGPMHTIGDALAKNKVIHPPQWVMLAERVGLKKVTDLPETLTETYLEDLLTQYGPLWCAGHWYGTGHAIVLTGITSKGVIFFNDPSDGMKKTQSLRWFNERIFKEVDGCMMFKDPAAY